MSHRSTAQTLTLAASAAAAIGASVLLHRAISKYGAAGLLRLIWEGDHLPPHIREAVDSLDELEFSKIPREERRLDRVEVVIETARLNSVDGPASASPEGEGRAEAVSDVLGQWPQVKKDLAMVSHRLDVLAADVDSVRSSGDAEVKRRKKDLSNVLVGMMERTDSLIALCGDASN